MQVTFATEESGTKWALSYGYEMAYIPHHVLEPLLEAKGKLFDDGYDELTKRYEQQEASHLPCLMGGFELEARKLQDQPLSSFSSQTAGSLVLRMMYL